MTTTPTTTPVPVAPTKPARSDHADFNWGLFRADPAVTALVSESVARTYNAFPARVEAGRLVVVMENPADIRAIQTIEMKARMEVEAFFGRAEDIKRAIDINYSNKMPEELVERMGERFADATEASGGVREIPLVSLSNESIDGSSESPVIQAIDSIVAQALKARATDIHIEPMEDRVRIRFRIDGFLQENARLPAAAHGALMSRIKIMAGMDIAERRRPQDGHFSVKVGEAELEIRAATTDTVHGEMAVLRVLNKNVQRFNMDDLGMFDDTTATLRKLIRAPYGIILVCGPTGSGKTTTLYASLGQLDRKRMNIITIEDPVEYRVEGINSIQINEKAGLTFSGSLRATLRLDPNVILVGEIRDPETARIAVQAALTGHLVLSSVHANDAVRAVARMIDLGVESFLLSSALLGVVSQRMVRRVCGRSATPYVPATDEAAVLKDMGVPLDATLRKGKGCYFCSETGYMGRTGIFEILTLTEPLKALILKHSENQVMLAEARKGGFITMKEDGARKVALGITTPEEIVRSVYVA